MNIANILRKYKCDPVLFLNFGDHSSDKETMIVECSGAVCDNWRLPSKKCGPACDEPDRMKVRQERRMKKFFQEQIPGLLQCK